MPVSDKNIARVTQLTNKTNQFNLTTRRYTEAQVRQLAADPACLGGGLSPGRSHGRLRLDRRDLLPSGQRRRRWEIDTWLMSCRVLGRQMEKFMFDRLVEAARGQGIREIHRRVPSDAEERAGARPFRSARVREDGGDAGRSAVLADGAGRRGNAGNSY